MATLKITQTKSTIGGKPTTRKTVRALGLKHIGYEVIHEDTPNIRGMIRLVSHLVTVEEVK